jgi:uncharacterized protein involved in exopolysaccharide biosynthesis
MAPEGDSDRIIFWAAGAAGLVDSMSERELTMEDYLAMAKRRLKVVLTPLLMAALGGYMVSKVFTPKYTSSSAVLVQGQKVGANFVTPVITADFAERVQTLSQQILATSRLQPMIRSLDLASPEDEGKLMGDIRTNMQVTPMITSMSQAATTTSSGAKKKPSATDEPVPGVNIAYTDKNPVRAKKVCDALTSLILDENLRQRELIAKGTTDFLTRQVNDAKQEIEEKDKELATFKRQYAGQLPGDAENNIRMLNSLTSQLDAKTQELNRAQQDKSYTESMIAQQVAAWKSSQSSESPQTLEQQLTILQTQLLQLQARYTDDYPDVIKTKADIAKVQSRLDEINKKASSPAAATEKANANEPPEIRTMRLQIHQYQEVIDQDTADQKKLQSAINSYQARTSMSPVIEQQYNDLIRGYDTDQKNYADLLTKQGQANLGQSMESQQQGEQMTILQTASLPTTPSFPVPLLFAAAGLAAGLGIGLTARGGLELSDKLDPHRKGCGRCDGSAASDFRALAGRGRRRNGGNQWQRTPPFLGPR